MIFPEKLQAKINIRINQNQCRKLKQVPTTSIDFCSNDHLSLAKHIGLRLAVV